MPHVHNGVIATTGKSSSVKRPDFSHMWSAFQEVVAPGSETSPDGIYQALQKVGDKIGGHVKINLDTGIGELKKWYADPINAGKTYPTAEEINTKFHGFLNACSIRLSYVLNKSGVHIPKMPKNQSVTGGDHRNYIYHVHEMKAFLLHTFGPPEHTKGGSATARDFTKKGIMVFEVGWKDASGHATLWNGTRAADHSYFDPQERNGNTLSSVRLWECR